MGILRVKFLVFLIFWMPVYALDKQPLTFNGCLNALRALTQNDRKHKVSFNDGVVKTHLPKPQMVDFEKSFSKLEKQEMPCCSTQTSAGF
jgi:hypothetical protein